MEKFYPSHNKFNFLKMPKNIFGFLKGKVLKKRLALLFFFLLSYSSVFAHAVQVGYVVLPNGFIRVYIEHWHSDQTMSSLMGNGMSITTTYGSQIVTQNVNPSGAFNNIAWNNLPGAGPNIKILSQSSGSANRYNDWAYYDFAPAACNVPVKITLNGGLTVVLAEATSNLWPQTISGTFTDTASPSISVANTTASVSCGVTGANVNFSAKALDNCTQNPSVTFDIAPGSYFPVGTTYVTASSIDESANKGTLTFPVIVSVVDREDPTINLNGAASINLNQNDSYTDTATAEDNCSATLAIIGTVDTTIAGVYTLSYTATDSSGNKSKAVTRTVTVKDITDPVLTVADINVNTDTSSCGADINSFGVTGTDNSGTPTITFDIAERTTFNVGTTVVTATATDPSNNFVTRTFNIIVADTEVPIITLNGDAKINHNAFTPYTDLGATASDNCSATLVTTGSVNTNVVGEYTITYTATDASGNLTTATRTIIVQDITAPVAKAQHLTVELDANGNGTITAAEVNNVSTDDSGGILTYMLNQTSFDCDDIVGSLSNRFALNFDGNDVVEISDASDLRITGDMSIEAWFKVEATVNDWVRIVGKGSSGPRNYGLWYHPSGVWLFQQYGSGVSVSINRPIKVGEWYHIAATKQGGYAKLFIDGILVNSGNGGTNPATSSDPLTIGYAGFHAYHRGQIDEVRLWDLARTDQQILDNYNKMLIGNEIGLVAYYNMEQGKGASLADISNNHVGALKSFTQKSVWTDSSIDIEGNSSSKDNLVTLTVTDGEGNSSTATANITIEDKIAPSIVSKSLSVTLTANGTVRITPEQVLQSGTDNCSAVIIYTLSQDTFGAADALNSPVTVQLTGKDATGNATTLAVLVTVIDPVPVVVTQNIVVSLDGTGNATITPNQIDNGSSSVVGLSGLALDINEFKCSNIGTPVTVTLTATSTLGSIATGTATVTVKDDFAPVAKARNVIVQLDDRGNATTTAELINNDSTDACGIKSLVLSKTAFTCKNSGDNTVTLTVTDNNGNVSTVDAIVTVKDIIIPVLLDVPANATASCDAIPAVSSPTATDNCEGSAVVHYLGETRIDGSSNNNYTLTRTWDATDASGNHSLVGTQVITVEDTTAPVLSAAPENVTVECSSVPVVAILTVTDNCDTPEVLYKEERTNGTSNNNYTLTRTWTATDVAGNSSFKIQVITVEDTTAPVLSAAPLDETVECSSVPVAAILTVTDNCDTPEVLYKEERINGASNNNYTLTRTWTATDVAGNSSIKTQLITVEDRTAPVLSAAPSDVTVECDSVPVAAILTVTDNCDIPEVLYKEERINGASNNNYTLTRTWTATDVAGNGSFTTQLITVEDTTAPVLSAAPSDVTVECDLVPVAAILTVTDNCDTPEVLYKEERINGASNNNYTLTRTWTATDVAGNSSFKTQLITVEDTTAPLLSAAPSDVTVECDSVPVPAILTVTDNCDVSAVVHYLGEVSTQDSDANTAAHYNYTLTRSWDATDVAGNHSIVEKQVITVQDITVPTVSDVADVTVNCQDDTTSSATGTAIGDDICSSITITQSDVSTQDDNVNTQGHYNYTITRTWRSTDITGLFTESVQVITVQDITAPMVSDVADVTVNCGASLLPSYIGIAAATDNCTGFEDIKITYGDTTIPLVCGGVFTRTWTAVDASGNTSISEQLITINPAALPTMTAPDSVTISIACGSTPVASTLTYTNGLSDGCELSGNSKNSTFVLVEDTCGASYIETWTATDDCGRALASVSRTVTVVQDMGALENFVLFSSAGAVGNTGASTVTGDIGTSVGAITNFPASMLSGSTEFSNAVSTQAKKDLLNLYIHLANIPVTVMTHAPVFGNGETLTAGVYSIAAAGSLVGSLTLDGGYNENSIFILKYNGAFSVAAASKVILINGQKASNVFWIAEGAISVGASSTIKGTLIAHTGAVSLGAGCDLEGRMFSTTGAVTLDSGKVYLPAGHSNIPIICVKSSPSSAALLGSVANFALFTSAGAISNIGASGIIGDVGSNAGAITGFETAASSLINNVYNADQVTAQAKIDLQQAYQELSKMQGTAIAGTLSGLTLIPGVYSVTGAGTLTGTITLDGQGDPNAVFVIKFGGAFSTEAQSRVRLINGTEFSNVFWVAEGAISMGASSFMKGTLISHNAAVSMGARGNLEGRMLSTGGAIGFDTAVAYMSYLKCVVSVEAPELRKSVTVKKLVNTQIELEAIAFMAYPNPFVMSTTISFTIPYEEANTTLALYDFSGSMIQVLYNGNTNASQRYEVQFNRQNLPTGIYIFRLITSREARNIRVIVK
jgi:hypothetical protein